MMLYCIDGRFKRNSLSAFVFPTVSCPACVVAGADADVGVWLILQYRVSILAESCLVWLCYPVLSLSSPSQEAHFSAVVRHNNDTSLPCLLHGVGYRELPMLARPGH